MDTQLRDMFVLWFQTQVRDFWTLLLEETHGKLRPFLHPVLADPVATMLALFVLVTLIRIALNTVTRGGWAWVEWGLGGFVYLSIVAVIVVIFAKA